MTQRLNDFKQYDVVCCIYDDKTYDGQILGFESDGSCRVDLLARTGQRYGFKTLELVIPKEFVFKTQEEAKKFIKKNKKEKQNVTNK